jgi:hypothetical protein
LLLATGIVAAVAASALPASAQIAEGGAVEAVDPAATLDPSKYGMTAFDDPQKLYGLLTQEGRCPPGKMAEPRQPCAMIFYRRLDEDGKGYGATFKPVFKVVSANTIWAMHDRKLKKVRINELYFDEPEIRGQPRGRYSSVAIIGNAENRANCEEGRPCLSHLVAEDLFMQYGKIPDSVVNVLWDTGMKDPGTVRVR